MTRFSFNNHDSESDLLELERHGRSSVLGERIRAIRLLRFSKYKKREICEILGRSRTTLLYWAHRYNEAGIYGLADRPNPGGRTPLCDIVGREKLLTLLESPPPDGGLWTGPKLRTWLESELGEKVGETQGWRTLKRLGFTLQVPKPRNTKSDLAKQAAFKK